MSSRDLSHHQNVWPCPDCGVRIPVLEGFGESIRLFHRQTHVIADQALRIERLTVERAQLIREAAELTHQRGVADKLCNELRHSNDQLRSKVGNLMTACALAGRDGITVMVE